MICEQMSRKAPLKSQLADVTDALQRMHGDRHQEDIDRLIAQLRRAGYVRNALRAGETAPEFVLAAADGTEFDLLKCLDDGPVVVTFIRGGWCPYCNVTLRALQSASAGIRESGGRICAISLESQDESRNLARQLNIDFPLLRDPNGKVAHLFGVLYQVPAEAIAKYQSMGVDLPGRIEAERWILPLAATYLIDQDAMVRYAFVEADPALRADPEDIITALDRLSR